MVSASREREGTSPRVLSPVVLAGNPRALLPDPLLGFGRPLSSLGASKEHEMLARLLGTPQYLRVPGQRWEDSSHSHASPSPRFSKMENAKKRKDALGCSAESAPDGEVLRLGGVMCPAF